MQANSSATSRELIAILRGISPRECLDYAEVLVAAGIDKIEIPLNSPSPLRSIERLSQEYGDTLLIGAGTVLSSQAVLDVHTAGGQLILAPNTNTDVIEQSLKLNMQCMPGVFTPTEALAAIAAGTTQVKLFPAFSLKTSGFSAINAILPSDTDVYAVGGIESGTQQYEPLAEWLRAGVKGFGIGSWLYNPSRSVADVGIRAKQLVAEYDKAIGSINNG
jgi:2-dehydro-3-deoxyphosphogalactonate aldolase